LKLHVDLSDKRFADVIEWRVNGVAMLLGSVQEDVRFLGVGRHSIEVGPPSSVQRIQIDIYGVKITSHESGVDPIVEGEPITFTAQTDPAGFESEVRWLAGTKAGSVSAMTGTGASFTVQFDDTKALGVQWLGVKANNVSVSQNVTSPVFYGVTTNGQGTPIAYIGIAEAPDLIMVEYDALSEIEDNNLIEVCSLNAAAILALSQAASVPVAGVLQSANSGTAATLWSSGFPDFTGTVGEEAILRRLSSHVAFFRHKSQPVANGGWVANGCTMAPDFNFTDCCDSHDECYCAQTGRSGCDSTLKDCIEDAGHPVLACLYWAGVRAFGWLYY